MASTLEVSVSSEGRVLAKQLYRGAALLRSCAFFYFYMVCGICIIFLLRWYFIEQWTISS